MYEEFIQIADYLNSFEGRLADPKIRIPLERLKNAARTIGQAWSGSWLGYQSRVYYENFEPPPQGAHFSQEWGFTETSYIRGTSGRWIEFTTEQVRNAIYDLAENPDLTKAQQLAEEAKKTFEDKKQEVLSLLSITKENGSDGFLKTLEEELKKMKIFFESDFARGLMPSGSMMSRDSLAATQGLHTPPHIIVLAEIAAIKQPVDLCLKLSVLSRKAGSHLIRLSKRKRRSDTIGTNVFIGHGGSPIWRELKDFIQDRLRLPWDEFNRVPVAGITNISRLSEMLEAAAIAFLVMTAEDEQADGRMRARMNVIHEAGLFQGRLGFTKAILLVEEGCDEFSNVEGLGQIRFPKGDIKAAFDEVRKVIEREGLIDSLV